MKKIIFITIGIFLFYASVKGQWIRQEQGATGSQGTDFVKFFNESTGYIHNNGDTNLIKTTNGGMNWLILSSSNRFQKIIFVNESTLLGISQISLLNYSVMKSTNAGFSWYDIYSTNTQAFIDIFFVNELTGWIGGWASESAGGVWRTTNGGQSFEQQLIDLQGPSFSKIFFWENPINGKFRGFASNYHGIRFTTNSGETWSEYVPLPTPGISKVKFIDMNTGFYSLYSRPPKLYKTTNGGYNWINILDFSTIMYVNDGLCDFKVIEPDGVIYCVGGSRFENGLEYGIIWKTSNGGQNWFFQYIDTEVNTYFAWGVDFINNNTGWISLNGAPVCYKTTNGGGESILVDVKQSEDIITDNFSLSQNYPNPFNPSTKINYEIKSAGFVSLKVFDLLGKEVATLVNEKQNAGSYAVDFNSTEFNLPSGIYFYTLNAGVFKKTRKMVLVK